MSKKKIPVLNRTEILQRLHDADLRRFGVTSLALFGSAGRDEIGKRSDVDILVTFSEITSDNYFDLKVFLENLLGRKVDLVTPRAIKPRMMPYIQEDLYAVTP